VAITWSLLQQCTDYGTAPAALVVGLPDVCSRPAQAAALSATSPTARQPCSTQFRLWSRGPIKSIQQHNQQLSASPSLLSCCHRIPSTRNTYHRRQTKTHGRCSKPCCFHASVAVISPQSLQLDPLNNEGVVIASALAPIPVHNLQLPPHITHSPWLLAVPLARAAA
jgi:hypothetical protein